MRSKSTIKTQGQLPPGASILQINPSVLFVWLTGLGWFDKNLLMTDLVNP